MGDYVVEITVRTFGNAAPRRNAMQRSDGRWRFYDRIRTTSARDAVDYFKHFCTTKPVPLTLELWCEGVTFTAAPGLPELADILKEADDGRAG